MNPSNLSLRQKSRGTVVKTIAIHLYGARDPNYIVDLTLSNLLCWYLTSVVLSQHVRKTGNPIRSLDLKLSCDIKVVPHGTRMRGPADRIFTTQIGTKSHDCQVAC